MDLNAAIRSSNGWLHAVNPMASVRNFWNQMVRIVKVCICVYNIGLPEKSFQMLCFLVKGHSCICALLDPLPDYIVTPYRTTL